MRNNTMLSPWLQEVAVLVVGQRRMVAVFLIVVLGLMVTEAQAAKSRTWPSSQRQGRRLQPEDCDFTPPNEDEPVSLIEAVLTSQETDCVYFIDPRDRIDLYHDNDEYEYDEDEDEDYDEDYRYYSSYSSRRQQQRRNTKMECLSDFQSGGKKELNDEDLPDQENGRRHQRQRRATTTTTRNRNTKRTRTGTRQRRLQEDKEEANNTTKLHELRMDTCNFNLQDHVSTGLLFSSSPHNNNNVHETTAATTTTTRTHWPSCVKGARIQAMCYKSVPDLLLLCPQDYWAYGGRYDGADDDNDADEDYEVLIYPRAALPADAIGAVSASNLARITPVVSTSSSSSSSSNKQPQQQYYDLVLGCAQPQCYRQAVETCYPDKIFVTQGPCEGGAMTALDFTIRGCVDDASISNAWEIKLDTDRDGVLQPPELRDMCDSTAAGGGGEPYPKSTIQFELATQYKNDDNSNSNDAEKPQVSAYVTRTNDANGNMIGGGKYNPQEWNFPTSSMDGSDNHNNVLCNQMEIVVRDQCTETTKTTTDNVQDDLGDCGSTGSNLELANVMVDNVPLPSVSFSTLSSTTTQPKTQRSRSPTQKKQEQTFCISKLEGDFTNTNLQGELRTEFWRGRNNMAMDIRLKCVETTSR